MASGIDGLEWVERHSAFQDSEHCRFVDEDFLGHSLDNLSKWRLQNTGGRGSHSLLDDAPHGVLRMTTGGTIADEMILDMNNKRQASAALDPILIIRARPTANVNEKMWIGLVDVLTTDDCVFKVDFAGVGNASIIANSWKAGAQTAWTDTGIDLDGNFHYYGIWIDVNGKPRWYIDGVLVVTGDNADVDTAEYFQPYVRFATEDAQARPIDVDFLKGWQRRS